MFSRFSYVAFSLIALLMLSSCGERETPSELAYTTLADHLSLVLSATLRTYEQLIFERLIQKEKMLSAHSQWQAHKTLPFPSQFLMETARRAQQKGAQFSYVLMSKHPLNAHNQAITAEEKKSLDFIYAHPGQRYYGQETLSKERFFIAAYPEIAYQTRCATCHNTHSHASKKDYQIDDIMGALFIRIVMTP